MTIPATSASNAARIRDEQEDQQPAVAPRSRRSLEPPIATRAKIDADLLAFVHNANAKQGRDGKGGLGPSAGPPPAGEPKNDRVLYVGMNDDSKSAEAGALRASGASVTTVLRDDATTVRIDDVVYDLASSEGCNAFAQGLAVKHGLPAGARASIATAFDGLAPSARDELARIASVLAPGERGAAIPSRLVFSGHSDGTDVHMRGEALKFTAVLAALRAMPNAARQIEDVHFSGCFTSAQIYAVDEWRRACPNLKTLWGYSGIAPGTPVGHLQAWDRSTRGRAASDPVRGARQTMTTWSARDGIRSGVSLETLRKNQQSADAIYDRLRAGDIDDGPWGQARAPYETYRELAHRPELAAQEKASTQVRADVLLRIRFYASVRTEFAKEHGARVRAGYESIGLASPDFASLSRRDALTAIGEFEAKARRTTPLPAAAVGAEPLLRALRELAPAEERIPSRWCY